MMSVRAICRGLGVAALLAAMAVAAFGQGAPASGGAPVAAFKPAGSMNLPFEDAKQQAGLDKKAEAAKALMELGDSEGAAKRYSELAEEWQKLANQWRDRALATMEKVAIGQATPTDAARAIDLYARGEAEAQRTLDIQADAERTSGKARQPETAALERLRSLNRKARSTALSDALRPLVRDAENRILALAAGRTARGDADGAFFLYSKLFTETESPSRKDAILERMLGLYTDLISARSFRVAAKVVQWYVANGDLRTNSWRRETIRMAKLILDPMPECGASPRGGKSDGLAAPDIASLLCPFLRAKDSADVVIWTLLGRAYQQAAEFADAIHWYQIAIAADDHNAVLRVRLAECLALASQPDDAVTSAVAGINLGFPVLHVLDDPDLASLSRTLQFVALRRGSLY